VTETSNENNNDMPIDNRTYPASGVSKNFIIAGGGTGGHIFPAIAIANAIKREMPQASFLFIGAKGKMEMEKVPMAGFAIEGLDIAGFNRKNILKNIGLPFKLIKSFFQVRNIFKKFKPDAVIGVGGYSSFPVLRVAQSKGIKTFLHESNSFAGKSNILLGKNATKIFVATKGMEQFFPAEKIFISGNPIRSSIINENLSSANASAFFGLQDQLKTILVMGGSLGATSINEAILESLDELEKNNLQLIWQTGKTNASKYLTAAANKKNIWVGAFIQEIEYGYAAADIIISRSGAMAVSEICVVAKPAILVPYPYAAEDHQTANALQLVNAEAAEMVVDHNASIELVSKVIALSKNESKQQLFKQNLSGLAVVDADRKIAKEIINQVL
jgi:UDP-N-acetylglucosamine--N-acetylmuramyl-(pentapeptide) pyrophosphoryl-undecaprenol N-acetylglucosamine transferase